jgi:hypothetical protein
MQQSTIVLIQLVGGADFAGGLRLSDGAKIDGGRWRETAPCRELAW